MSFQLEGNGVQHSQTPRFFVNHPQDVVDKTIRLNDCFERNFTNLYIFYVSGTAGSVFTNFDFFAVKRVMKKRLLKYVSRQYSFHGDMKFIESVLSTIELNVKKK